MAAERGRPVIGITTDIEGGCFSLNNDYAGAVWAAGGLPLMMPLTGEPEQYVRRLQGILIPGGADVAPSYYSEAERPGLGKIVPARRTDFEMALVKAAINENIPLLSICYGMQLANVALGGALYQDLSEHPAAGAVFDHKEGSHDVGVEAGGGLPFEGAFRVNTGHHQALRTLAPGLRGFAHAADGVIEGVYHEGHRFFVGVQWHPERMMEEPLSAGVFGAFIKAAHDSKRK